MLAKHQPLKSNPGFINEQRHVGFSEMREELGLGILMPKDTTYCFISKSRDGFTTAVVCDIINSFAAGKAIFLHIGIGLLVCNLIYNDS